MDLRMCPSCQQSVLDDDVTDCPFCGAAMDGSRPAAPAKPQTQTQTRSANKSTSKKESISETKEGQQKARPAKEKEENADPFAVKAKVNKTAIALRRKPTAKIAHRVVCPMCDTSGFATKAVAGKEVKCPNPKCLMPIFNAPEIKKEEPVEEKKTLFTPALLGGIAGGVVIAGILAYFFLFLPPQTSPVIVSPDDSNINPNPNPHPNPNPNPPTPNENLPPKISLAEIQKEIFKENTDSVLQRTNNRSKSFCRRLSSETYTEMGNIKEANYQLQKLDQLRDSVPFFKIVPLVKIGWYHLKKGDRNAAKKVASQAMELTASFPNVGTDAITPTVFLASLLIALEEHGKAGDLIEAREKVHQATLQDVRVSMILQDSTFDLSENHQWLPHLKLKAPLAFAAAYGASVRGFGKQTMNWETTLQTPTLKSNALAGHAAGMCIKNPDFNVLQEIRITGLLERDNQRAIALCLNIKGYQKKEKQQKEILTHLLKSIDSNPASPPMKILDFNAIYEGKYKPATREIEVVLQTHLLLYRDLAIYANPELAWEQFELAMKQAKATAYSREQAAKLTQQIQQNRTQIQDDLAQKFKITQPVNKRNAFSKLRANVLLIESDAEQRFQLERVLVQNALKWGLVPQLYQKFQAEVSAKDNSSNFVAIVKESLLSDFVYTLKKANKMEVASELQKKHTLQITSQSSLETLLQIQRLVDAGSIQQAHSMLKKENNNLNETDLELRFACQIAKTQSPAKAIQWTIEISNVIEQELAFQLSAAIASQKGAIREYWKVTKEKNLFATKKCSVHLGLIEGVSHTNVYKKELQPEKKEK